MEIKKYPYKWVMTLKITKYPFKRVKGLPCANGQLVISKIYQLKKLKQIYNIYQIIPKL